jgi:FkbM family methyltransferase
MFTSYAQNFEDIMLWRALKHVQNGVYVDIGAQSPHVDSVSRLFHEAGWKGVHVEPVARWADELRRARPNDLVVEAILGASAGETEMFVFDDSGLSTTTEAIAKAHERQLGKKFARQSTPRMTLAEMLKTASVTSAHWMKIDVEGDEHEVIKGWDSEVFRPWIVLIESYEPNSRVASHARWEPLLLAARYVYVYQDGLNRFYIAREHESELRHHFASPPNVFDEFAVSTGAGPWGYHAAMATLRLVDALAKVSQLEGEIASANARAGTMEAELKNLLSATTSLRAAATKLLPSAPSLPFDVNPSTMQIGLINPDTPGSNVPTCTILSDAIKAIVDCIGIINEKRIRKQ